MLALLLPILGSSMCYKLCRNSYLVKTNVKSFFGRTLRRGDDSKAKPLFRGRVGKRVLRAFRGEQNSLALPARFAGLTYRPSRESVHFLLANFSAREGSYRPTLPAISQK
jgi:hypothetical protein